MDFKIILNQNKFIFYFYFSANILKYPYVKKTNMFVQNILGNPCFLLLRDSRKGARENSNTFKVARREDIGKGSEKRCYPLIGELTELREVDWRQGMELDQ